MNMDSVTATRLRAIVARELNIEVDALLPDNRLREDLGMDSIIALNLIFAAERELHIRIEERQVVAVITVADLERLVARLAG